MTQRRSLQATSALPLVLAALGGALVASPAGANCTGNQVTTCGTATPNPFTDTVGDGRNDNNRTVNVVTGGQIVVTDKNAISLGDKAKINLAAGTLVQGTANVGGGDGKFGTGMQPIEFNSNGTLFIGTGAQVIERGTDPRAEAINVHGVGNRIENRGTISGESSAAIWFEDEVTTGAKNVVDNYGTIEQINGGTVIGTTGGLGIDFYNQTGAVVKGSLAFSGGNDRLFFFAGSTVTGNIDGGGGSNDLTLSGALGTSDIAPGRAGQLPDADEGRPRPLDHHRHALGVRFHHCQPGHSGADRHQHQLRRRRAREPGRDAGGAGAKPAGADDPGEQPRQHPQRRHPPLHAARRRHLRGPDRQRPGACRRRRGREDRGRRDDARPQRCGRQHLLGRHAHPARNAGRRGRQRARRGRRQAHLRRGGVADHGHLRHVAPGRAPGRRRQHRAHGLDHAHRERHRRRGREAHQDRHRDPRPCRNEHLHGRDADQRRRRAGRREREPRGRGGRARVQRRHPAHHRVLFYRACDEPRRGGRHLRHPGGDADPYRRRRRRGRADQDRGGHAQAPGLQQLFRRNEHQRRGGGRSPPAPTSARRWRRSLSPAAPCAAPPLPRWRAPPRSTRAAARSRRRPASLTHPAPSPAPAGWGSPAREGWS